MVIYIEDYLHRRCRIAPAHALKLVASAGGQPKPVPGQSLAARARTSASARGFDVPRAPDLQTLYAEATLL